MIAGNELTHWFYLTTVIILHDKGANIYNLATNSTQQIINEFQPHRGAQYKDGFLFTCLNKVFIWQDNTRSVEVFAGNEMEGSRNGTSLYSQFHAPIGIAVEFGNVVYVGGICW